ncbi:hypothetical protein FAI41_07455 [Acetobacteraceae bacterium]|nr:hypothetical protein FAI41_07455 [Acetobacteraceae bacterium]
MPLQHARAQSAFANLRNPPPMTTISDGEEVIKVKPHKKANSLASALNGGTKTHSYAPTSSLMNQRNSGFQPFRSNNETQILRGETKAFGSMPLPIAGGEFAPYLGAGSTYEPEEATWLPKSFPAWMDQETVTGDWGGWRTLLKNRGVNIGGRWLMEWNGDPGGGRKHAGSFADEEAVYADFDLQKLLGVHLGTIHYLMTMRQGSVALSASAIPALDPPQEIAGGGQEHRAMILPA